MAKYTAQAARIRQVMAFYGFIQDKQLCKVLEIPSSTLSGYLSGNRINVDFVILMVTKLNISSNWLLCGIGPMLVAEDSDIDSDSLWSLGQRESLNCNF